MKDERGSGNSARSPIAKRGDVEGCLHFSPAPRLEPAVEVDP